MATGWTAEAVAAAAWREAERVACAAGLSVWAVESAAPASEWVIESRPEASCEAEVGEGRCDAASRTERAGEDATDLARPARSCEETQRLPAE